MQFSSAKNFWCFKFFSPFCLNGFFFFFFLKKDFIYFIGKVDQIYGEKKCQRKLLYLLAHSAKVIIVIFLIFQMMAKGHHIFVQYKVNEYF